MLVDCELSGSDAMRFGFVGLGWAARSFHVPALRELSGVELVGGADSAAEQRASWASRDRDRDIRLIRRADDGYQPDVVVIATPPDSHAELCVQVLSAGAHVLCEKPFVASVADADT